MVWRDFNFKLCGYPKLSTKEYRSNFYRFGFHRSFSEASAFRQQRIKRGAASKPAPGAISKGDLEKLIAAASQTAPAQTIRIEQAPIKLANADEPKK